MKQHLYRHTEASKALLRSRMLFSAKVPSVDLSGWMRQNFQNFFEIIADRGDALFSLKGVSVSESIADILHDRNTFKQAFKTYTWKGKNSVNKRYLSTKCVNIWSLRLFENKLTIICTYFCFLFQKKKKKKIFLLDDIRFADNLKIMIRSALKYFTILLCFSRSSTNGLFI